MAASRDDMVLRPKLKLGEVSVRERAKEERDMERAVHRRGRLGQWLRHRAGRFAKASTVRVARALRARALSAGGATGGRAASGAARTPVGAIVVGVVIAVAVVARLISGRSFENMGAQIQKTMFGDYDEEALAGGDARNMITGNPMLTRIVGKEGKANAQIQQVYENFKKHALLRRLGDAKINESTDFQVNNMADMAILRMRDGVIEGWKAAGGEELVRELKDMLLILGLTRFK